MVRIWTLFCIENLWCLLAFGFSFSYSLLFLLLHLSSYSDDCLRGFQEKLFTPSRLSNALLLSCWSLSHPFPPIHLRTYQLLQDLKSCEQLLQHFSHKRLSPIYHQQINSWLRLNDLSVTWSQRQIVDLCERRNQWIW